MSEPEHQPRRPEWDCETCGEAWPCPPARARITAETGGRPSMLMASYLVDFCHDRPGAAAGAGFDRMVAWTRLPVLDGPQ